MTTISFSKIGSFGGVSGGPRVLRNPTSLQFGPDGRLYVSEQNGTVNAFTVELQEGEYVATDHEVLQLLNESEVVKSIANYDDDGSVNAEVTDRQVTGIVVTGTAANPILYVSSSDPRVTVNGDSNLDTNSGIVTQVTWTGTEWEAIDIIRGLPRSEANHSINGMVLSPDGTKLYLTVGGNTNNGAPSQFFSYTSEYALSGTVLEIDLTDINQRPVLTDPTGGQNGTSRQYIYDLPTLDDPTVPNDGIREDSNGLDVAGPFGGNDGFNQAILPADAPLRIFADGFRNHYDLVLTESGHLFSIDNGSNNGVGGDPIFVDGEPTDRINDGGQGALEPLFLLTDGGYFGHPNPTRANQDLAFTVYDDDGNPDLSLAIASVPNLADLVPEEVDIAEGFIIDPSRFTGDPARLAESGIRIPNDAPESLSLANLGSSSNGLVEYTADAFDGALQGALLTAQFNGSVVLLNINDAGTALEPLIDPGTDGILGTADDEAIADEGVLSLFSGLSQSLDVTIGPEGTIFVAELGSNNISVFAPADFVEPFDTDLDDDGILNVIDPFSRDATNGGSAEVLPGQTLLWDFDADQDGNLPGPSGFGGGLTGVQTNGLTDFEEFFQEPSPLPGQLINLDNAKFTTAAGGGTTVIENVSSGTPFGTSNNGKFLFQTGVAIAPIVDTFTVTWRIFNPANSANPANPFTEPSQRIGGFIGTGDQSNFLAITAGPDPSGEIQVVLEDNDVDLVSHFIPADDLFAVPRDQEIFFALEIDPTAATATPTITYELGGGNTNTVSGEAIDLTGTRVLEAILGNEALALGLLSTTNANGDRPEASTFQAVFNDIEIAATGDIVLFRVNAGGPLVAAGDGGPDWLADTRNDNSPFLADPGSNSAAFFPAVDRGPTVEDLPIPDAVFDSARFDARGGPEMQYAFGGLASGNYEVRLYFGNGFASTSEPGQRIFDVSLEGSVPASLDDIDPSGQFGHQVGGVVSNIVRVDDGTLDIEFIHGVANNPLVNGIEILQVDAPVVSIATAQDASEPISNGQFVASLSEATSTDTVLAYTIAGTATPDEDYTALPGTVTIPAGALSATIEDAVLDDGEEETDESIEVTIDAVIDGDTDVVLGTNNSATVAITDDDAFISPSTVLFRVNAGGSLVAASDGGPDWLADTRNDNSPFLADPGSNSAAFFPAVDRGPTVEDLPIPDAVFDSARFDARGASEIQYAFGGLAAGDYEVRLYFGNGFASTSEPGQRIFDVALEGSVPASLDDIDPSGQFGHQVGGVVGNIARVDDGTLDIEFIHGVANNPLINGIEILRLP